MDLSQIAAEVTAAAEELIAVAKPKEGRIFVLGCSTSEVLGSAIGTARSPETAETIINAVLAATRSHGLFLAVQCCEHLNRALVVERGVMERYDLEQVNAIPQPNHAGGAFATVAYQQMKDPVLVESLDARADAGMDIGGTLIGMHIHPVVVPLRISLDHIGEAVLICARRRPKYVGGSRAIYDEALL